MHVQVRIWDMQHARRASGKEPIAVHWERADKMSPGSPGPAGTLPALPGLGGEP